MVDGDECAYNEFRLPLNSASHLLLNSAHNSETEFELEQALVDWKATTIAPKAKANLGKNYDSIEMETIFSE